MTHNEKNKVNKQMKKSLTGLEKNNVMQIKNRKKM